MQTVVETEAYLRDAKAAKLSDDERKEIVNFIAANPGAGHEIPGTGGARKVRFAGKGKGKSGGYRVITFYSGEDIPVFLLNVFAKNETSSRPYLLALLMLTVGGRDHDQEETNRRTTHDRQCQTGPRLRQGPERRLRCPYP
jgi:hypothetical protein